MDHTPADLIVVDERHRLPIGRPYVTAAVDEATRCVPGFVVTLEAPSATSVGLCLAQMCIDKRALLESLDVDAVWPMSGKPRQLYLDNASEFHSEALRRGCEQHGIKLDYRPPGEPQYGGIVERLVGTMMHMLHELPGTTFSNTRQRRDYDSDATAVLTLAELQKWMTLAVAVYHGTPHDGLGGRTPAGVWAEKAQAQGAPSTVTNQAGLLVDFLPVIRRTLTRSGFTIDHVQYYSDALKPLIARRDRLSPFVLRRDPRDISRVWALDPETGDYLELPYRTLSRPAISAWEHKSAVARIRDQGRSEIDENSLFAMVDQMRHITENATASSRRARRNKERRTTNSNENRAVPEVMQPPPADVSDPTFTAFGVIEQW
ncbi:MAG: Mu transposase C-terminal domain-containing protein [Thermoguttaceae bacterium]